MHRNTTLRRLGLVLVAALLLVGAGTTGALAQDGSGEETVKIGAQHVVISDAVLTIGDANVSGDGLEDEQVENQSYRIGHAELTVDGLNFSWNGTTYNVCRVDIVLDDVGVVVEDLSVGSN